MILAVGRKFPVLVSLKKYNGNILWEVEEILFKYEDRDKSMDYLSYTTSDRLKFLNEHYGYKVLLYNSEDAIYPDETFIFDSKHLENTDDLVEIKKCQYSETN